MTIKFHTINNKETAHSKLITGDKLRQVAYFIIQQNLVGSNAVVSTAMPRYRAYYVQT